MGRKCVAGECKTNYESEEKRRKEKGIAKVSAFKFPRNENEKQMWIAA